MADNKKYYYLKLKDNFYDSEQMIILESMENGYLYSNILMKMYLRSLRMNGKLMLNDRIPYNVPMLSKVLRHNVDIVEKAIKVFKELDLIEIMDDGVIYMLDIQNFIGKSSTEADRIRNYRQEIVEKRDTVQMYNKCSREIEIEIDIDNKERSKKESFNKPTIDEIQQYCDERNNGINANAFYDFYESKNWYVGKNKMRDWKACIRTWEQRNKKNKETAKDKIERYLKNNE